MKEYETFTQLRDKNRRAVTLWQPFLCSNQVVVVESSHWSKRQGLWAYIFTTTIFGTDFDSIVQ